jgi:hypothetical protein
VSLVIPIPRTGGTRTRRRTSYVDNAKQPRKRAAATGGSTAGAPPPQVGLERSDFPAPGNVLERAASEDHEAEVTSPEGEEGACVTPEGKSPTSRFTSSAPQEEHPEEKRYAA